jgi:hypothetical protein
MIIEARTPLLGTLGTVASLTLEQWNSAIGIVAGVLTVAYMVRQHVHFRRDKRK